MYNGMYSVEFCYPDGTYATFRSYRTEAERDEFICRNAYNYHLDGCTTMYLYEPDGITSRSVKM